MRIVYIHTDPFPSEMAGSVFALSTSIGLAKAGHEVTLLMPKTEVSLTDGLEYYGMEKPANLNIELPASNRIGIGPLNFSYTPKYYRAVHKYLTENCKRADGIIVRTLRLADYLLAHPLPAPLFYEMHDWYGDIEKKWSGAKWMITAGKLAREKKLAKTEKRALPKAAGIICLNKAQAKVARDTYPDSRIEIIPTGLDAPTALPEVSDEPVVVYAGQLHAHKGLSLLLDAAQMAPMLRFMIVGGGGFLDHWKNVADEKGIADRIEFTGHVPKAELSSYLAKGRVGVLPLLDCFFNRYLTSPLKIREYFAAGLPVVTADAPVMAGLVEHEVNGLLYPFEDASALARNLERLCTDKELHSRCRTNIESRLVQMSWSTRGQKLAAVIGAQNP